jgi:hypothetical protein
VRKLELRSQDGRLLGGADTELKPSPKARAAGGMSSPSLMQTRVIPKAAG